jgi:glycine cleavage system H protein
MLSRQLYSRVLKRFTPLMMRNLSSSMTLMNKTRSFSTMYFTKTDEYLRVDGDKTFLGVSDYAQDQLNEIVYVEMPNGNEYECGDELMEVESTKGVSAIYAPVDLEVVETNDALEDSPELVNDAAESDGWFIQVNVQNPEQLNDLMSAEEYKEYRDL